MNKKHGRAKGIKTAGRGKISILLMIVALALAEGCGGESKEEKAMRVAIEARMKQEKTDAKAEMEAKMARSPDVSWYGSHSNEFNISTAQQLAGLAQLVNGGESFIGKSVFLTSDIDVSAFGKGSKFNNGKGWIPIGRGDGFFGTFDGNGKKISGLYINNSALDRAGLFASVGSYGYGTVKNLGVVDVDITGGNSTGAVVGYLIEGSTYNCYSSGTVNGKDGVGGVVGAINSGNGSNLYSTGTVSGNDNVGGVAGYMGGGLSSSYSTGAVSGNNNVGGLVGSISLESSYCVGGVSSRSDCRDACINSNLDNCDENCCTEACYESDCENPYSPSTLKNSAALNTSVHGTKNTGRVVGVINNQKSSQRRYDMGTGTLYEEVTEINNVISNNIAFSGLKDRDGRTNRWTAKGAKGGDGADITAATIAKDGTLGQRFTAKDGWATENGKLPGLGREAVDLPEHLK
ncbi:MAG: hypothetical protein FWB85_11570 [Chitinispirillia bacterium]|nr:hypothetical protein [Chitinispirillia bacterium]MCL2242731.1 hypothetical protein [Chitinispirillia bacterium]